MEFKTRISKIENGDLILRGEKLSELVQKGKFTDAIFLQLTARKPTEKESILFEKILTLIIDHGMAPPSSLASRFIISGGNALNVGVAGGILAIGDVHGGALEKAMEQMYSWKDLSREQVIIKIKELLESKKPLYGFGHKHYKDGDPRVALMKEEMQKINFDSSFIHLQQLIEATLFELKGKKIPMNVDGIIAMLLCDFGLPPPLGKGIFIIGRTPGLVGQAFEELWCEKPFRRLSEDEITYLDGKYQPWEKEE